MKRQVVIEALILAATLVGIGAGLVTYVHANFAEKSKVEKMDERLYQVWTYTVPPSARANLEKAQSQGE